MTHSDLRYIAVDGGGTRCRFALQQGGQRTIIAVGPTNMSSDFEGGIGQLNYGVNLLVTETGLSLDQLSRVPAYLGLAGVIEQSIADDVAAHLPFVFSQVEDDRPAALRGALGTVDGFLAHCGTGSFLAAQRAGEMRFVGGWGADLGDEASASWIGRRALALALDVADGLRAATELTTQITAHLDGPTGIVRYASEMSAADLGGFAPEVTRRAQDGDEIAIQILTEGADYLQRVLSQLGWAPGRPIRLTGGVGSHFGPFLPDAMQSDLAPPDGEPLDGALAFARDLARRV